MSEFAALAESGVTKMRLPHWNEHAYVKPDILPDGRIGPWSTLYDVGAGIGGGAPVRVLTLSCDQVKGWIPA